MLLRLRNECSLRENENLQVLKMPLQNMGYKIIFLKPSLIDLDEIYNFIWKDSKIRAKFFILKLKNRIFSLVDFPFLWKNLTWFWYKNLRELVFHSYRIIYEIDWKNIFIIAIFHWSKNDF